MTHNADIGSLHWDKFDIEGMQGSAVRLKHCYG